MFRYQNFRMKYINRYIILAMAAAALLITATEAHGSDDTYRREADSFLSDMPAKLQENQAGAIRMAIAGDTESLDGVRNSRNSIPQLPAGIRRMNVGGNLALFRDIRYDNDTIPLLIYFHGGGWTIGSINSCSRFCAAMAGNGIAVLAVDYRLAPEHGYPEGLDDCMAAVDTAAANLDRWKCSGISLGGDSSGGNLAIATAMSFPRDTFRCMVAFYPVTKAYADNSSSWKEFGDGFGLDSGLMEAFNEAYTSDIHNPLVSPAEASDDVLKTLPPTLMVAADRDILRDQGADFADRLRRLGNKVEYRLVLGSVHLFITVPGQAAAFGYAVSEASAFIHACDVRADSPRRRVRGL